MIFFALKTSSTKLNKNKGNKMNIYKIHNIIPLKVNSAQRVGCLGRSWFSSYFMFLVGLLLVLVTLVFAFLTLAVGYFSFCTLLL